MALELYIGVVIDNNDKDNGDRIQAKIMPVDDKTINEKIPWAFPLLPKALHIKPKKGESVFIICDGEPRKSQRYYIGPLISQPQYMYKDNYINAASLLNGGISGKDKPLNEKTESIGAIPNNEEIAITGRKNSDIIISDDDIRIRSGVHLNDKYDKLIFNQNGCPAYIKLKYDDSKDNSTATIVANNINLLSHNGSPYFNLNNKEESISSAEMEKIVEEAHQLPYGDILVHFLSLFLRMFESHTHKYPNDKPCPDTMSKIFYHEYSSNETELKDKLLSDNVRIN